MSPATGPITGNNTDPVLAAYQSLTTPEEQANFRSLVESPVYTNQEIAAALQYLGFTTLTARDVERFKLKLAQGRVAW